MQLRLNELLEFLKGIRFADPTMGVVVALLGIIVVMLWDRLQRSVAITSTAVHKPKGIAFGPMACALLLLVSWVCFGAAAGRPQLTKTEPGRTYESRSWIIAADNSGSMGGFDIKAEGLATQSDAWIKADYERRLRWRQDFPDLFPDEPEPPLKRPDKTDKDMVQREQAAIFLTRQFLLSRPTTDRFGMFTFNSICNWVEPLGDGTDRDLLIDSLPPLTRNFTGGTNFDGPTGNSSDVGAFQKMIWHFQAPELNKTRIKVFVLISDGDAGISPERHDELVAAMKPRASGSGVGDQMPQEIHVYALVCGPEASVFSSTTASLRKLMAEVNPQDAKRPEFKDTVFWAGNEEALNKAFALMDRLETTPVQADPIVVDQDVADRFIGLGFYTLIGFLILCVVFREET